ncbi:MAG: hypothetical protein V4713_05005 [Pseudomonadota bacterium]
MKSLAVFLALVLSSWLCVAGEVEYRTGGQHFDKVWHAFYVEGDHEPELDDPLIAAGRAMTLAICEAIAHPDMKRRRYAIGALGYIRDKRALPTLENILKDRTEIYYFRGDALHAIYQIDKKLGSQYAVQFANEHDFLKRLAVAIQRREPWLTESTRE